MLTDQYRLIHLWSSVSSVAKTLFFVIFVPFVVN
jgi:hypothetical protein